MPFQKSNHMSDCAVGDLCNGNPGSGDPTTPPPAPTQPNPTQWAPRAGYSLQPLAVLSMPVLLPVLNLLVAVVAAATPPVCMGHHNAPNGDARVALERQ